MSEGRKRGGQTKPAEERKRNNLTFRVRDKLRGDLEVSAARHGRSVSEEIEHRLEMSIAGRNLLIASWGEDYFQIASLISNALSHIEKDYGSSWHDNEEATEVFKGTAAQVIQDYKDHLTRARTRLPGRIDQDAAGPAEKASHYAKLGMLAPARPASKPEDSDP